jgi:ATP-dependent DNA helicase RecG
MAIHLGSSVSELPGIGGMAMKSLKTLGVSSVRDLLWYVPFRYDDFSVIRGAGEVKAGETVTVIGTVQSITSRPAKSRNLKIVDGMIEDETGELKMTWFNQSYLERTLPSGTKVAVAGLVDDKYGLSMTNPVIEKLGGAGSRGAGVHTGRIVPVYGLTGSIKMNRLRNAMKAALPAADEFPDWLPIEIVEKQSFSSLAKALKAVHFPDSRKDLDDAIERLKFDELFLHQLMFAHVRTERSQKTAHPIELNKSFLKDFVASLPFTLTNAQKKAIWEIVQDMEKPHPMNRLLEGDVGSGKTVVSAVAAASALRVGQRVVYLAPTEILATQQYATFVDLLNDSVALLTRSQQKLDSEDVSKSDLIDQINNRAINCIIGTHALLQDKVQLGDVGLMIIDEQHRFGVEQRHALLDTGDQPAPHLLSMTATPIPRSLALTIYGDLELSILNEMPKGRLPVATAVVPVKQQEGMWSHVRTQVGQGRQVFVVCPLIDPSDKLGAKSVTEVAKDLKKGALSDVKIGVLHGRLKSDEKEDAIVTFRDGKTDVLVSTTVVEVGVDIPNASVMVIVGAERFGLAQLHQLRGRVGRSDIQSYCYLLPGEALTDNGRSRLTATEETVDGFKLAEKDLELRGPGNVFGNAQSGFPNFQLATPGDVEIMKRARELAGEILEKDPTLESHPLIAERIEREFDQIHLE